MAGDITTAAFGLGGVALGGVINYYATTRTETQRGQAALRTAARLVEDEMANNTLTIHMAIESDNPLVIINSPLQTEVWEQHREILAQHLPTKDWHAVRHAYWTVHVGASDVKEGGGLVIFRSSKDEIENAEKLLSKHGATEDQGRLRRFFHRS